jgi:DNA-directed RNA polymerase specialized sigma24 family protein
MNSKINLNSLISIVNVIARMKFHVGHPHLNLQDLVGEGQVLIVKLLKDNPTLPQSNLEALLRTSFNFRIIELRRRYCLSAAKGENKVTRFSKFGDMVSITGRHAANFTASYDEPDRQLYEHVQGMPFHKEAENAIDVKRIMELVASKLSEDDVKVFYEITVEGLMQSEVEQKLGITRHKVRSAVWNIKKAVSEVLYDRDDMDKVEL